MARCRESYRIIWQSLPDWAMPTWQQSSVRIVNPFEVTSNCHDVTVYPKAVRDPAVRGCLTPRLDTYSRLSVRDLQVCGAARCKHGLPLGCLLRETTAFASTNTENYKGDDGCVACLPGSESKKKLPKSDRRVSQMFDQAAYLGGRSSCRCSGDPAVNVREF